MPIKSVTLRSRDETSSFQGGGDEPGPAIVKLLEQLKGIQQGKIPDSRGWVTYARDPAGYGTWDEVGGDQVFRVRE